ncbi:DUF2087 domain-containing protein [Paenibacillus sp. GYB003]|uniref:DUF2087 domain-containing protein n=1 Tax=Paenibacillus sp. GYB003 TaxID=2994392 RepID=UPI002F964A0A
MNDKFDRFWDAGLDELKRGYAYDEGTDCYVCLVCGERFEKGAVYPLGPKFYEAEKRTALHVADEHGSMFDYLLQLDKKLTGLSDLQKQLLRMFYDGVSDRDIVTALNGGSASTIRNHRFLLREKEKQAKLFVVLMELLRDKRDKKDGKPKFAGIRESDGDARETDSIGELEREHILRKYFPDGPGGPLTEFPRKEKRKLVILDQIAGLFEPGRRYTEKEVNDAIEAVYHDYVTIRRYLVDFGFMDRKDDGSEYWLKERPAGGPKSGRERESGREAKRKTEAVGEGQAGVFRLLNKANGKMLIESANNLRGAWNRLRFALQTGYDGNRELLNDWNEYGEEQFAFDILETYEPEPGAKPKERRERLKEMERRYLDQLRPYGDRGYNKETAKAKSSDE